MADRKIDRQVHDWVEERLSAYLDEQLQPLERAQVDRHLRECARCQRALASLRWTIKLLKQAPAPALPRQFTLPVPAARAEPARGVFLGPGLLRLATAIATVLLVLLVGLDAIMQLGGAARPSTSAPLASQPTLAIALGPQATSAPTTAAAIAQTAATAVPPAVAPLAATAAPSSTASPVPPTIAAFAAVPKPTAAPLPTSAPAAATSAPSAAGGPPQVQPTRTRTPTPLPSPEFGRGGGAPEPTGTAQSKSAEDSTGITATGLATPPEPTPTATPVPPTATATAVPPTPTAPPTRVAQVVPTRPPLPPPVPTVSPRPTVVTPLRIAELGALFFAVFFGALTVLLRRR